MSNNDKPKRINSFVLITEIERICETRFDFIQYEKICTLLDEWQQRIIERVFDHIHNQKQ